MPHAVPDELRQQSLQDGERLQAPSKTACPFYTSAQVLCASDFPALAASRKTLTHVIAARAYSATTRHHGKYWGSTSVSVASYGPNLSHRLAKLVRKASRPNASSTARQERPSKGSVICNLFQAAGCAVEVSRHISAANGTNVLSAWEEGAKGEKWEVARPAPLQQ